MSHKIFIILAFMQMSIAYMSGQAEQMKFNEEHFHSVFAKVKSGKFEGTANGVLLLMNPEGQNFILDFQGSSCNLTLDEDDDEVYDVSTKSYLAHTTSGKTRVIYRTYAFANELNIEYQEQFYSVGIIDGACDLVIDGLSYAYMSEAETEYLILTIKKELRLSNRHFLVDKLISVENENKQERINEEIKKEQFIRLQPNSVIVFAIKRTQ